MVSGAFTKALPTQGPYLEMPPSSLKPPSTPDLHNKFIVCLSALTSPAPPLVWYLLLLSTTGVVELAAFSATFFTSDLV